jgi:hypothetical protein
MIFFCAAVQSLWTGPDWAERTGLDCRRERKAETMGCGYTGLADCEFSRSRKRIQLGCRIFPWGLMTGLEMQNRFRTSNGNLWHDRSLCDCSARSVVVWPQQASSSVTLGVCYRESDSDWRYVQHGRRSGGGARGGRGTVAASDNGLTLTVMAALKNWVRVWRICGIPCHRL